MFENVVKFLKKFNKKEKNTANNSKDAAKERLHLVLMQDRANVSADFLELMKQEIIEVIKKYIEVDESAIDVRLTNKENADGTNGAPALYANIPILNIKNEARKVDSSEINKKEEKEKEEDKNQKEEKSNSSDEKKENNEENKKTSEDIEENSQAKQSEEKIEEKSETDIKENKENIEKTENAEVESKEKIKSKNK